MTFDDFLIKYNGVYVDFDGYYGAQCMDLMHQYVYDVLGLTDARILAAPTAKDVYLGTPFGLEYFDKIDNTPTGVPQEGDIVFFGTGVGPAGHVCIFISGDANKFKSFDVNWPVGSPAHVQDHTYGYCLGWLRPKGQIPDIQGQLDQCRVDRDNHWNDRIAIASKLNVSNDMTVILAEIDKLIHLEDAVVQKDKQLQDAQAQATSLKDQLKELTDSHNALQTHYDALQGEMTKDTATIADLSQKLKDLEAQIKLPVFQGWKKALLNFIAKL